MSQNADTLVNPFNAYGIPAFQFQPAAVGTAQACANCGNTRAWSSFHYELGLYVCSVCTAAWKVGRAQPSDAIIGQTPTTRQWQQWWST